jgi:hypothetical protein
MADVRTFLRQLLAEIEAQKGAANHPGASGLAQAHRGLAP